MKNNEHVSFWIHFYIYFHSKHFHKKAFQSFYQWKGRLKLFPLGTRNVWLLLPFSQFKIMGHEKIYHIIILKSIKKTLLFSSSLNLLCPVWRQDILNIGHLDILSVLIVAANLEDQCAHVIGDRLLGDALNHFGHRHLQTLFAFGWKRKYSLNGIFIKLIN